MNQLDPVFTALADPTRRRVVELLGQGARRASDLAQATGMGRPAMSNHLRVLRSSGLVDVEMGEDDARARVYRLRGGRQLRRGGRRHEGGVGAPRSRQVAAGAGGGAPDDPRVAASVGLVRRPHESEGRFMSAAKVRFGGLTPYLHYENAGAAADW